MASELIATYERIKNKYSGIFYSSLPSNVKKCISYLSYRNLGSIFQWSNGNSVIPNTDSLSGYTNDLLIPLSGTNLLRNTGVTPPDPTNTYYLRGRSIAQASASTPDPSELYAIFANRTTQLDMNRMEVTTCKIGTRTYYCSEIQTQITSTDPNSETYTFNGTEYQISDCRIYFKYKTTNSNYGSASGTTYVTWELLFQTN